MGEVKRQCYAQKWISAFFFFPSFFLSLFLGYFTLLCITHSLGKPALFLRSSFRKGHHLENRKFQIMNKEMTGRLKTQKEWIDQALEIASNTKLISKFLTRSNHSSAIPLSRNRIVPAINTLRATKRWQKKKVKFPAVLPPHCQGLL